MEMIDQVLHFWFEELAPKQWWKKDPELDRRIAERFAGLHESAVLCELHEWRQVPLGRLAEIIIIDQFSRNIHRDNPRAFAADPLALALAQEAVAASADRDLDPAQRSFLYMPYMHSESPMIHEDAERLFRERAPRDNHDVELRHKAIIERFGRYPHRNAILGRLSTEEELAFLRQPGSAF